MVSTSLSLVTESFAPDFRLHSFQKSIFQAVENNPRICVVASRQIGKSETLLRLALAYAQAYPKQLILIVSAGERQASEILKRIKTTLHSQRFVTELSKESATEIELKHNGSRILSLPNNPATVRGYPCHLLIVDEVDSIEDWQAFTAALWPSVSRTNGKIVCSGTYHGKRQLYELTQDPIWKTFIFSWQTNPPKDIEQQRHDLPPSQFSQEFECVAVDESGSLFPYDTIHKCIDNQLFTIGKTVVDGALYFAGYDPAKLADPSIVQVLELLPGDYRLRLIETRDYSGMNYSIQGSEIKGLHQKYYFHSLAVDKTGIGEGAFEAVQKHLGSRVIGMHFTRNLKEQLINDLRIAFQDQLISIPRDNILIRELHDLDPSTLDHKSNGTSDRLWALALAWHVGLRTDRSTSIVSTFDITEEGIVFINGQLQGKVISFDDLDDYGFMSYSAGFFSIARIWQDKEGNRHIVECWRRKTHVNDALENAYRLHQKRPFDCFGIEQKFYEQIENEFNSLQEKYIDLPNPLPLYPIELSTDREMRHMAALQAPIATGRVTASKFIQAQSNVWGQISNLSSLEDDARDAIASALGLAENSY